MLTVNVVTIFPDFFTGPLGLSIPARAAAAGAVSYNVVDLRDFTRDRHRTVDDAPYGGGAGMVMKPDPFFEAVESLGAQPPVVLVSARGRQFTHADAVRYSAGAELTILCGHYKDVDQRVADHLATEEISLGDFVLSGGEPAALAIIDATVRLLPGAMSDMDSARTDSFYDQGLSAPSYTRPPVYRGFEVPEVLLSGDHARIARWRKEQAAALTAQRLEGIAVRPAIAADRDEVLALLARCELPSEGALDQFPGAYVVAVGADSRIIGCAAVERHDGHGLLRSVAVDEKVRGRGIAARLLAPLLREADSRGQTVFLLTTTAEPYFLRRGFTPVPRADAPDAIRGTSEFSDVCPSSAVLMVRRTEPVNG